MLLLREQWKVIFVKDLENHKTNTQVNKSQLMMYSVMPETKNKFYLEIQN